MAETDAAQGTAMSWRWWAALVLITCAVCVYVLSRTDAGWRVCEEVLATTGNDPTTSLCRSLSALDLSVVLLPIAILLFPDVAELAIPGLISLKRDVAVQANRQESLEKKLVQVELAVSQAQTVNIFNYPPEKRAHLAEKEEAFRRGGSDE